MPTNSYPNGIGGSLGDSLVSQKPLLATGNVWFVSSLIGVDAASPAGQNREKPLATLAQAVTNAADNDIVVFLSGHTQALTAVQALSKRLCLIGEGSTAGVPTVSFTLNAAGNPSMFTVSGGAVELRNIKIGSNAQANTAARIAVTGSEFRMRGCYVECNGFDEGPALSMATGADRALIENSTFISTATSLTDQPESAIKTLNALADIELRGLVLSGGACGFSNYYAFDGSAAAITRLKCESLSLLLGADFRLHASTTGWVSAPTCTGGSRLVW